MVLLLENGRNCNAHEVPDVKRRRVVANSNGELKHPQNIPPVNGSIILPPKQNLAKAPSTHSNTVGPLCSNPRPTMEIEPFNEENELTRNQTLHISWRQIEESMPGQAFGLSFDDTYEIEQIRSAGMESILSYIQRKDLSQATLHLAAHYTNRLFYYYAVEKSAENLPPSCLFSAVATALRTAVKIQERWEHTEPFRLNPEHLWSTSSLGGGYSIEKNVEVLNQMERLHLSILEHEPVYVPVSADFLEQYLVIGGWPERSASEYRKLSLFLLALSLFSTGRQNPLMGVTPSKLAAAALILSVKIINTDSRATAYEFWTKKLEAFTKYTVKDLQPVVHALSRLLRRRQSKVKSEVFSAMFPVWSKFSWS